MSAAILLALVLFGSSEEANAGPPPDETIHVVSKGQTLGRIAKRYHTTVEALRRVNQLKPNEPLKPGITLVIPVNGNEALATKRAMARKAEEAAPPKRKESEKGGKRVQVNGKIAKATDDKQQKPKTYASKPRKKGLVRFVRGAEKADIQILTKKGQLLPSSLAPISRMLRFGPTGAKLAVEPRLATLLGLVSDHFGGRPLHIVSGFRPYSPSQYTPHSNHNVGRAVDFSVEGIPNTVLVEYCRTLRNAGVGYYPNSTFVHLDVRPLKTYWVDYSRPGERPQYNAVAVNKEADEVYADVEQAEGVIPAAPSQAEEASHGERSDDPFLRHSPAE